MLCQEINKHFFYFFLMIFFSCATNSPNNLTVWSPQFKKIFVFDEFCRISDAWKTRKDRKNRTSWPKPAHLLPLRRNVRIKPQMQTNKSNNKTVHRNGPQPPQWATSLRRRQTQRLQCPHYPTHQPSLRTMPHRRLSLQVCWVKLKVLRVDFVVSPSAMTITRFRMCFYDLLLFIVTVLEFLCLIVVGRICAD